MNVIGWANDNDIPFFVLVEEQRAELRMLGVGTDIIVVSVAELPDIQKILANPLTDESRLMLAAIIERQSSL